MVALMGLKRVLPPPTSELGSASPERFLGGAWSGDVLAFDLERGKVQPFGEPITTTKAQEGGGAYGEDGAPVTALAAAGDVVVTGTNCGCIRFSRMVV